jgi:hypothetical protein
VTKSNPDQPARGGDLETAVEIPTGQSQQRRKTIAKPELRWDEDADTALVPVGAIIPAEAYRDAQPRLPSVTSTRDAEVDVRGEPPALGAEAPSAMAQPQSPALPIDKPRRTRRWLLSAFSVLLAFAATYVAMSMVREMRARPSGAVAPTVWATFVKVLGDVRARLN